MEKNGKNIKCKRCGKEFYISNSRFLYRKFCSLKCSKEYGQSLKPRTIKCLECKKEILISVWNQTKRKFCSLECREKNRLVSNKCKNCGEKILSSKYAQRYFCGEECRKYFFSENRKGTKNPNYKNGLAIQGSRKYTGIHLRACAKYKNEFLKRNDYLRCENCGVNKNGTLKFEVHHIYTASRYPKHKELHNPKNLILLCIRCHNDFHLNKKEKEFKILEKDRGLKKLFA